MFTGTDYEKSRALWVTHVTTGTATWLRQSAYVCWAPLGMLWSVKSSGHGLWLLIMLLAVLRGSRSRLARGCGSPGRVVAFAAGEHFDVLG